MKMLNNIKRTGYKLKFKAKKHSPEILIVAGVIGTITSTVMACKATTKLQDITEDAKDQIDSVHEAAEHPENLSEEYTEQDAKHDLTVIYTQTGIKVAKLYMPSIILGSLSIASIVTSHNILRKRNMALAAAYTTVDKCFKDYRGRVVERFGEEIDKELRYNIKSKEIETVQKNDDGTEEVIKEDAVTAELNSESDYARIYDCGCYGWSKDPATNLQVLKKTQAFANQKLKEQGFLFLNDVYKMLNILPTKAGQVVGWIYDEKNPIGDNYVDFGLYDIHDERKRAFINGIERNVILDFNVDGNILDRM